VNKKKVPFPRYLNSKKLFYIWEQDVVFVSAATSAGLFMMFVWFSVPILVSLLISMAIGYLVLKRYIKYFKKAREGYVWHFLYSKGFISPFDKRDIKHDFESSLLPYGFEREFIN
jgi:type IV conjugative transfer system protein TraL